MRVELASLAGPLADEIRALRQHPAGLFALDLYRQRRAGAAAP